MLSSSIGSLRSKSAMGCSCSSSSCCAWWSKSAMGYSSSSCCAWWTSSFGWGGSFRLNMAAVLRGRAWRSCASGAAGSNRHYRNEAAWEKSGKNERHEKLPARDTRTIAKSPGRDAKLLRASPRSAKQNERTRARHQNKWRECKACRVADANARSRRHKKNILAHSTCMHAAQCQAKCLQRQELAPRRIDQSINQSACKLVFLLPLAAHAQPLVKSSWTWDAVGVFT